MSTIKFLEIVRTSYIQDKLMAESELENLITNTTTDPKEKLIKVKEAVRSYTQASLDMASWESFVSSNIIIPKPQTDGDGNNNPEGENKH
jgi:hypothetical protein